jgi:hypothetical protein
MLKRYLVERDIPGVGKMSHEDLCKTADSSNQVLASLAPRVQWIHSFLGEDRAYCFYVAENDDLVRRHSEIIGLPANRIVEVPRMIDPTTP